jgi:hypothetical protein
MRIGADPRRVRSPEPVSSAGPPQVCWGQGSAVAAREVSRFARNSREGQKLVEVCRVVDTLLIDQEMVYTPRLCNDRLRRG